MTYAPAPSRALDSGSRGVELFLEVVHGAETLHDSILEGTVAEDTTATFTLRVGRRKVLPEEGVVDVTCIVVIVYSIAYECGTDADDPPPPLNLRAAWRAMRSLGVEALA